MDVTPEEPTELKGPATNPLVCPHCGKAYEGESALSYHRKAAHSTEPFTPANYRGPLAKIRNAVTAGFISVTATVIFAVTGYMGFDAWALIDAGIILGLTIGVWNRNRGCAIALFGAWTIEKLLQWVTSPDSLVGLPIAVAFAVFFYQGVTGTFALHRLRRAKADDSHV